MQYFRLPRREDICSVQRQQRCSLVSIVMCSDKCWPCTQPLRVQYFAESTALRQQLAACSVVVVHVFTLSAAQWGTLLLHVYTRPRHMQLQQQQQQQSWLSSIGPNSQLVQLRWFGSFTVLLSTPILVYGHFFVPYVHMHPLLVSAAPKLFQISRIRQTVCGGGNGKTFDMA